MMERSMSGEMPPLPSGERDGVSGSCVRGDTLTQNPLTQPSPPRGEGFKGKY